MLTPVTEGLPAIHDFQVARLAEAGHLRPDADSHDQPRGKLAP